MVQAITRQLLQQCALCAKNECFYFQLVLALYPQTTCFYRALIHEPPSRVRLEIEDPGYGSKAWQ